MSNENKKRLQLSFTQPGHALAIVISMVCVITILFRFAPDHLTIGFLRSVHLLALSMLNGVAFWVTFVGGKIFKSKTKKTLHIFFNRRAYYVSNIAKSLVQ